MFHVVELQSAMSKTQLHEVMIVAIERMEHLDRIYIKMSCGLIIKAFNQIRMTSEIL